MRKQHHKVAGCLALTLVAIALAGCSTWGSKPDGRTSNQQMNDSRITSQVEQRLDTEPVYKFTGVDVKTFNGVVQLSGFVDTEQQKARAGELAQNTPGVTRIDNVLALKAPSPTGRTNDVYRAPIVTNSVSQ